MPKTEEELFGKVTDDPDRRKKIMSKPYPPEKEIVIHFTARSGSTRVTEILQNTRHLGKANELFNPSFVPNTAQAVQAHSLPEYIENSRRMLTTNGVFSFEATGFQINQTFQDPRLFFESFKDASSFWLIREDIVAQAVSLAKMVQFRVSHSTNSTDEDLKKSDEAFEYDHAAIQKWTKHLLACEGVSEKFFKKFGVTPVRISYERLSKLNTESVLNVFKGNTVLPPQKAEDASLKHKKIGTPKNKIFAERFREESLNFLKKVEDQRAFTLEQLAKTPLPTAI